MPFLVGAPQPLRARQGREQQRYGVEGDRLVAGCIPYRYCANGVEVLMVSSRAGKGYSFPKGGWETDESPEEAARRETVEEAGVRGELDVPGLGEFRFSSNKPGRDGGPRHCTAHMYALHVTEVLEDWPEARERQRAWMGPAQAMDACRYEWMKEALRVWAVSRGFL